MTAFSPDRELMRAVPSRRRSGWRVRLGSLVYRGLRFRGARGVGGNAGRARGDGPSDVVLPGPRVGEAELDRLYAVYEAMAAIRPARIRLDLRGARESDSRLVACLVAICRRARNLRVAVEIRGSPEVRAWLEVCRLPGLGALVVTD
ncbi:MAG: hypothetical protein IBJ11_02715 [Phycisphaerales bacterium]|nr:hypothetical protein [Phycisphaerales bacterium]